MSAVAGPGQADFAALLVMTAAGAAWLVLGWLLLAGVAVVASSVAQASGAGTADHALIRVVLRISPVAGRRAAALILGLALLPAGSLTAKAADHDPGATPGANSNSTPALDRPAAETPLLTETPRPPEATSVAPESFDADAAAEKPGWLPDRPAPPDVRRTEAGDVSLVATAPRRKRAVLDEVIVRRGDSLWSVVAGHLGVNASAADIAEEWPRWYAANRTTIGSDPHLIRPGQSLRAPNNRAQSGSGQEIQ